MFHTACKSHGFKNKLWPRLTANITVSGKDSHFGSQRRVEGTVPSAWEIHAILYVTLEL